MQQPMDSWVCGIDRSSESILIRSYLLARNKHVPVEFWYDYFTQNVNLTKREIFLTSNSYHKRGDLILIILNQISTIYESCQDLSRPIKIDSFSDFLSIYIKTLDHFD